MSKVKYIRNCALALSILGIGAGGVQAQKQKKRRPKIFQKKSATSVKKKARFSKNGSITTFRILLRKTKRKPF